MGKAVSLAFAASSFAVVVAPRWLVLGILGAQLVVLAASWFADRAEFHRSWFWTMFLGCQLFVFWPLSYLVPVVAFALVLVLRGRGDRVRAWFSWGEVSPRALALSTVLVVGTSAALVAWVILARPNLDDLRASMPDSLAGLLVVGALFSVANAVWEEVTFKAILWDSMVELSFSTATILVVQALLFGLVHLNGFPRGWVGAGLAAVYGLVVGVLKTWTKALGLPIVVHVFADATIFVLLASMM